MKRIVAALIITLATNAQAQDGIPGLDVNNSTNVNITYTDENENIVSENFKAPGIIQDSGPVAYLDTSPIDPRRRIENLPTFALAKFHWWLFGFEVLPRAQRQYAQCIGEIRAYQKILGISPLIDEPGSPVYDTILSVREYTVPFEPIQRLYRKEQPKPPTKFEAILHAKAAMDSVNTTVFHKGLCEFTAEWYRQLVHQRIGTVPIK